MVSFSVDPAVRARFPRACAALIQGVCASNSFSDEPGFLRFASEAEAAARAIPVLAEHPKVAAWRKMYRAFGEDPTKRKPSAEALAKRIRTGEPLPRLNAVVDCYNAVSLKHTLPVGGQDADCLAGEIVLRFAREGEPFIALGGEAQETNEGEVVYADSEKILCRKWNYRDCESAKISERTRNFILVVDGAEGISIHEVEAAAKELCETLKRFVRDCTAAYSLLPFS